MVGQPLLLRVALLSVAPVLVLLTSAGGYAGLVTTGSSIAAAGFDIIRQRRRNLPFPIFLLLVYAVQIYSVLAMPVDWDIEDMRARGHTSEEPPYSSVIRTMSIVIAAHNEHPYMVRTLDSIYASTPPNVLKEIIVVDDASTPPLAGNLTNYKDVKILRHEDRRGLIKSKTEGGNWAAGDMIMFLDGHVKPEPDWWRPLLEHMNQNYKRVVVPIIPLLDPNTWEPNNDRVGIKMMFDWTLSFNWFEDGNDVVPCMSGGLFGITRRWWHESGEYDYGMQMWGAENIEQSIRVWLCGGEVYVARDSRVGHVFRDDFPYSINFTQMGMNKVRAVEVWFDEYKENFYAADPAARQLVHKVGDLSERFALKQRLKCKPFSWYVEKFKQVFADKHMLPEDVFLLRDRRTGSCLRSTENATNLEETPCQVDSNLQQWTRTQGEDGFRNVAANKCLDSNSEEAQKENSLVLLYDCSPHSYAQTWTLEAGRLCWQGYCIRGSTPGALRLSRSSAFLEGSGDFEVHAPHMVTGPGVL